MYEEIFQSPNRPFRATPDAKFYFPHDSIETARKTVQRVITRAEGPAMVLGGAGLGKSLLGEVIALDLNKQLDVVRLHAARLCSRRALLQNILFELQLPYRNLSEGELRLSILDRLEPSSNYAPEGVLFVVDEAHVLPSKLLDELRLINNFTRNNQPRTRLVLIGNLRLEDTFAHPHMESFSQRLAARCYLQPMTRAETHDFVRHQLTVAGTQPNHVITSDGLNSVYTASEGVPRIANQIMDHALVLAMTNSQNPISAALIEEAWADLQQLPAPWHSGGDKQQSGEASAIEFGSLSDEDSAEELSESPTATVYEFPRTASATQSFENASDTTTAVADDTQALPLESSRDVQEMPELLDAPELQDAAASPRVSSDAAASNTYSESDEEHAESADEPAIDHDFENELSLVDLSDLEADLPSLDFSDDDFSEVTNQGSVPAETNFFAAFSQPNSTTHKQQPASKTADETQQTIASQKTTTTTETNKVVFNVADAFNKNAKNASAPASQKTSDSANDRPNLKPEHFFDNQPTDEKMIAFEQEQAEYESMGVWDNDPPLAADAPHSAIIPVEFAASDYDSPKDHTEENPAVNKSEITSSDKNTHPAILPGVYDPQQLGSNSNEVFGNDFTEEFTLPLEGFTGRTLVSNNLPDSDTEVTGEPAATGESSNTTANDNLGFLDEPAPESQLTNPVTPAFTETTSEFFRSTSAVGEQTTADAQFQRLAAEIEQMIEPEQQKTPAVTETPTVAVAESEDMTTSAFHVTQSDFDPKTQIEELEETAEQSFARETAAYIESLQQYADSVSTVQLDYGISDESPSATEDEVKAVFNAVDEATEKAFEEESPAAIGLESHSSEPIWAVDVAGTDVQSELELQNDIEDLVSQLNFSAFAVEPFSVEQISLKADNYRKSDSVAEDSIPKDSIRNGNNEEIYMLHRAEFSGDESLFTEATAEYDDDRDMLVIEDDIPITNAASQPNQSGKPVTQTAPYSQLFAKLRK